MDEDTLAECINTWQDDHKDHAEDVYLQFFGPNGIDGGAVAVCPGCGDAGAWGEVGEARLAEVGAFELYRLSVENSRPVTH